MSGVLSLERMPHFRQAAASNWAIAWTNAARSIGPRAVTILPSMTAGLSMKVAPALSRSGLILAQPVALPASQFGIRKHPWAVADRGDDLARRRRLDEADRVGVGARDVWISRRPPE
jgi:hypothetical protein